MKYLVICCLAGIVLSCGGEKTNSNKALDTVINPASEGFDEQGSDQKAIAIADQVMEAMGGRKNWDKERYFQWNFFGFRTLWWDKHTGNVRIEIHNSDSMKILVNIYDDSGRVSVLGQELMQPDSVSKYVKQGKGMWINDSYWLFMPFKLKDTGVTLTYVSLDTIDDSKECDVLQLTFRDVGNTPQNKYHVWVDCSDHLIKQWAYYKTNDMDEPTFITPWNEYKKYNTIYLAGDRGQRQITDIQVTDQMDESLFNQF